MKKNYASLILILALSGCAKEVVTVYKESCWGAIYYDRLNDTTETIQQIQVHNMKVDKCLSTNETD